MKYENVQKVVEDIEKKASAHEDAKWLSKARHACMKMSSRPNKEQPGKVSSKAGIARKSKTKKRRKRRPGKRRTRWTCNGLKMRSWRRFWNEESERKFLEGGRHAKDT